MQVIGFMSVAAPCRAPKPCNFHLQVPAVPSPMFQVCVPPPYPPDHYPLLRKGHFWLQGTATLSYGVCQLLSVELGPLTELCLQRWVPTRRHPFLYYLLNSAHSPMDVNGASISTDLESVLFPSSRRLLP